MPCGCDSILINKQIKTSLPFGAGPWSSLGAYFRCPFSLVISKPVFSSSLAMASSLAGGGLPTMALGVACGGGVAWVMVAWSRGGGGLVVKAPD